MTTAQPKPFVLDLDLRGLENRWEIECVDRCAHCGLPMDEDEVPVRIFTTKEVIPLSMAFHPDCFEERLIPQSGAGRIDQDAGRDALAPAGAPTPMKGTL